MSVIHKTHITTKPTANAAMQHKNKDSAYNSLI
jgi:hypothetical protein